MALAAELHTHPPEKFLSQPELPSEIILYHILPRLPGKSVLRYKCVSKQWHAFLTTPIFKSLHFHHIINKKHTNNPSKLLFSTTAEPCKFYSIDSESPQDALTAVPNVPPVTTGPNQPNTIHVLTSFHGLVCVGIKKYESINRYTDLLLWNPLTREYKTLSKGKYSKKCYEIGESAFSMYYSFHYDDYKLLRLNPHIYLYSLKSDSWRKLGSLMVYFKGLHNYTYTEEHWWAGIWLNEKHVYFFREVKCETGPLLYVLRYDATIERFRNISPPPIDEDTWTGRRTRVLSFSVVRGCILHLCVGYYYLDDELGVERLAKMELWRMDADEDGEWTKVVSYSNLSCLSWFENGPVHVMRNGNWLMHSTVFEGNFCQVDLEKSITNISSSYSYATGSKLSVSDMIIKGKYTKTFMSPNQYAN